MKKIIYLLSFLMVSFMGFGQDTETQQKERPQGHYNISKFKQLETDLPTANTYRTASGAPGHEYYQQKVDYRMDIVLDDANQRIFGEETVTYFNNSPDDLQYLWIQLDQNVRAADAVTNDIKEGGPSIVYKPENFTQSFFRQAF